jgi:diamine N-acetyltransferase
MRPINKPECGKVALRPTCPRDLEFVLTSEQHRDNSIFIRQWSAEQHLSAIEDPDIGHFIVINLATCQPVGYVILVGQENPDFGMELRRLVITKKGCGYGREAMRVLKSYAFENLNCHRLWLDVMLHNRRAYKLYKSEGFTVEGVHREAVRLGSRFLDVKVMSMLRNEYFEHYFRRPTRLLTDMIDMEECGKVLIR